MTPLPDIEIGTRFGKLVTTDTKQYNGHSYQYKCMCDCGFEYFVTASQLLRNPPKNTTACKKCRGDLSRQNAIKRTGYHGSINKLFYIYKRSASMRDLPFEITIDHFVILTQNECYYCGSKPSQSLDSHNDFNYNGIDRIDNTKGYVFDNVVSCCKVCNYMKGPLTHDHFIETCKRIAERNKYD